MTRRYVTVARPTILNERNPGESRRILPATTLSIRRAQADVGGSAMFGYTVLPALEASHAPHSPAAEAFSLPSLNSALFAMAGQPYTANP